jgi:hypothetical protein
MEANGYWYKKGKLFDLNGRKHIDYIIAYPEKFNLPKGYIETLYDSHNEKVGVEGKAREELIKEVSKEGWIRIRHYTRPRDYWSIQFDNYRLRKRDIKSVVEDLIYMEKKMYKDDELILVGYDDGTQEQYSYQNGGATAFLNEQSKTRTKTIVLIETFEEF